MRNFTKLQDGRVESLIAREHDEGKVPRKVPEIPDSLVSCLGFPGSSPELRRAYRKAWLAFRKYDRRQSKYVRGANGYVAHPEAHQFKGETRPFRSFLVAEWLLWKMCPEAERPEGWPSSERELAERHRVSQAGLASMVHRIQGPLLLQSMFVPFDAEDLNRKADRLLTKTLVDQESLPASERDPRWVDVAYKRTGAVSRAMQVSKTQIHVAGNLTQNVVQLSASERTKAEERLKLHAARHYREVPSETEALEVPVGPDAEQPGPPAGEPAVALDAPHPEG